MVAKTESIEWEKFKFTSKKFSSNCIKNCF